MSMIEEKLEGQFYESIEKFFEFSDFSEPKKAVREFNVFLIKEIKNSGLNMPSSHLEKILNSHRGFRTIRDFIPIPNEMYKKMMMKEYMQPLSDRIVRLLNHGD